MKGIRADLHLHTAYSDGSLTPEYIVNNAISKGIKLVAVTDHDCMEGCNNFLAATRQKGLLAVSGAEISAYCGNVKFHTLGYGMDENKFRLFLDKLYKGSCVRAEEIISKLNKIGVEITLNDVNLCRFSLTAPIHVMHVANALVNRGYADTPFRAFGKYLAFGKPAFSSACRPTPEETVKEITAAGGFAVVAHPARIDLDGQALYDKIKSLKDSGLGGIEVYYSTHTNKETDYYNKLAKSLGLVVTGGSDTYHPVGNREIGKPEFFASPELLEKLKID